LLRAQLSSLSSVKIERNSHGANVEVKGFGTELQEVARLVEVEYDRLVAKYSAG
jgi:hypothetical protein